MLLLSRKNWMKMRKTPILTDIEKAIYSTAFSEIKLGKKYNSPFRSDPDPSFEFFINNKSKRLWWHDWGTGEKGNCYAFLDKYPGEIKSKPITIKEERKIAKEKEITTREFTGDELAYWRSHGINEDLLNRFNVKAIDEIDGIKKDMTFLYTLPNGRYKVYSPLSKFKKWRFWGTMKASDIFGLQQARSAKDDRILIITKSLKDVMTLWAMGIPAIATASETANISKAMIGSLKSKFKKIYLLYDNDEQGRKSSKKISAEHDLINIELKIAKDISDCVKKHGFKQAVKHLSKQIRNS